MHVLLIRIVLNAAADQILADALKGDREAAFLLAACSDAHRAIASITEPSRATASCMCCFMPFWMEFAPAAIIICTELDGDDTAPATFGLCSRCREAHRSVAALKDAIIGGCRMRLGMPELRLLSVHAPGHA